MNILFVNDIPFNPMAGGLERVTDVLTKELVKRGYTIYYLCGKLPGSKSYLLDYTFPAKLFQLPNYGMFDNEENISYYKQLQSKLNIDIVINQRGLDGWFNSLLPLTQTKLISVIHSIPDAGIIMYLNKLVELTVPPFVSIKKFLKKTFPNLTSKYWKRKALKNTKLKYNELAHLSNAIVTLSNKDIECLKELTDNSNTSIITSIPNPNTFNIKEISFTLKDKIILYVGRLAKEEKEPIRLLKIWKYLYKTYPDWHLVIVGDGKEKANMLKYTKEKQLRNVIFEGRQSDVAKYYRKAQFICLTSHFEGWGMTLTEGMQHGCIPFTFNNYGAAFDIIDDGVNGCLIPAYNLKEYASRLSELMSDDNKRLIMSNSAIEKVKIFSVKNVTDKWEKLFLNLLK